MIIFEGNKSKIPEGPYCYDNNGTCPYWYLIKCDKKGRVVKAGCKFTGSKDKYYQDLNLLWDKVKNCGINDKF